MTTSADPPTPIRPFDARMLDVGDGHWIYVEEVGCHGGRPIVFLHGGPGSGSQAFHRHLFDLERDHVFLIDQRGAGRSHPQLCLTCNTTPHLVRDIEEVRMHFGIERWLVVGGSWGSTLALAYAEAHPERVTGLVLRAVFLGTSDEVTWAFETGPQMFRPDLYTGLRDWLPEAERAQPLASYFRRLTDQRDDVRAAAAHVFGAYERALSKLVPSTTVLPAAPPTDSRVPPTPQFVAHYAQHDFFLAPGQLIAQAPALAHIPLTIVQGRYDLLCPPRSAYALAAACPLARLNFIDGAGHDLTDPGMFDAVKTAIAEHA